MRDSVRRTGLLAASCILLFGAAGCAALSPGVRGALANDWEFARRIHGRDASPLHRRIFGDCPLDGGSYRSYFDERVRDVRAEEPMFASCHGAFACGAPGGTIRLSERYGQGEIPQVARLSYLIHEAAHADGSGAPHLRCPASFGVSSPYLHIPLAGKEACDGSETGAYGVQIVALANIAAYCDSCEPSVRDEAGRLARALLPLVLPADARARLFRDLPEILDRAAMPPYH